MNAPALKTEGDVQPSVSSDIAVHSSQAQHQNNLLSLVNQLATNPNVDPDRVDRAFAMYKEVREMNAKESFNRAMAAFKRMGVVVEKNTHVSYTTDKGTTAYAHASLDNCTEVIGAALSECGLSYYWETEQANGVITVTCVLSHEDGHSTRTPLMSTPDSSGGKNGIQSVGSTITYLQRYTLLAATGTATKGQDDDGRTAEPEATPGVSAAQQAGPAQGNGLPPYPADQFKAKKNGWMARFKSGKSSPEHTINMISTKYTLSEEQKLSIRNMASNAQGAQ
jgi:hypothetical protein